MLPVLLFIFSGLVFPYLKVMLILRLGHGGIWRRLKGLVRLVFSVGKLSRCHVFDDMALNQIGRLLHAKFDQDFRDFQCQEGIPGIAWQIF